MSFVQYLGRGLEDVPVAEKTPSQAEIDILQVGKETLVESKRLLEE